MINNLNDFQTANGSILCYKYSYTLNSVTSSPPTFHAKDYVTDTMRSYNGYTSANYIKFIEIRVTNVLVNAAVAGTSNVPLLLSITPSSDFVIVGATPSYSAIAPLVRPLIGTTVATQLLQSPVSVLYYLAVSANFNANLFSINLINAVTGATISNGDQFIISFDWIEYVALH